MKMNLKYVPQQIALCYAARSNLVLLGQPGIGKTYTVEAAAKKIAERVKGFQYVPIDVPTMAPPDIGAFMPSTSEHVLEFYANNVFPNHYRDPNATGILFLGEMLNVDPATGKLLQKYCNGEDINGRLRKPNGFIIIADSNRLIDKSGVLQQSRAFLNRFAHLHVFTTPRDNLEYAEANDFHPAVTTFLKEYPDLIDTYEQAFGDKTGKSSPRDADKASILVEEGKQGVWACMRGWERISKLEIAAEAMKMELDIALVMGSVGSSVGAQYNTHRAMVKRLATVEEIVRDPKHAPVPDKPDALYAQLVLLTAKLDDKDMGAASIYLDRVRPDLKAMAVRRMILREDKKQGFVVTKTKEYRTWMSDPQFTDMLMARG